MKENTNFMDNLNIAIDRKIEQIEAGKMEPVTKMRKSDYEISALITTLSLVALIVVYYCI